VARCYKCGRRAVYHARHFGKLFCDLHFKTYMVRRLRRQLYQSKTVDRGDCILIHKPKSPVASGAVQLFRDAVSAWDVTFTTDPNSQSNKELFTTFLEQEVNETLLGLGSGVTPVGKVNELHVRPFLVFPGRELVIYGLLSGAVDAGSPVGKSENLKPLFRYSSVALNLNCLRAIQKLQQALQGLRQKGGTPKVAGRRRTGPADPV